jgi:hypothetical protein
MRWRIHDMQCAAMFFSHTSLVKPLSFMSSVASISRRARGGAALHKRTSARDTACIVRNRGDTTNLGLYQHIGSCSYVRQTRGGAVLDNVVRVRRCGPS